MKKYSFVYIGLLSLFLSSCIKEDDKTFSGETVAEIDYTVLNSLAVGVTYPIITRYVDVAPFGGRAFVTDSDSTIRRLNNTTVRIRVNLVGPQSSKDETVAYTVFNTTSVTSVAFAVTKLRTAAVGTAGRQEPDRAAATLNLVSGVANTHYAIPSTGFVTIPANSSFGYINVGILNNNVAATEARFVGIELVTGGTIRPNPNYSKLGIAIDQR